MGDIFRKGETSPSPDGLSQHQAAGAGGGDALVANPLSQFAATTSAQLAGVLSDETGTGAAVFANTPTLVTPLLGTPTSGNLSNCTALPTTALTGIIPDARMPDLTGDVTTTEGTVATSLATKLKTVSRTIYIEAPTATDDFPICYVGDAVTIVAIRSVTDIGTVTFNVEQRGKFTPATAGTNVMTADQVADITGEEITSSFADATVPADNWLCYSASAVASSPTKCWINIEYTID